MITFRVKRILMMGMKSLWLHKLRSGLTMLGITFGVCSVVAMLAIGEGASQDALRQIEKLGSQNIIVQSVEPPEDQSASGSQTQRVKEYGLTYVDADRIRNTVPDVTVTAPQRRIRRSVIHRSRRMETNLVGTVPWYLEVSQGHIKQGRFLTDVDMDSSASVCVIGTKAAEVLFPMGGAIGSVLTVDKLRYRVVGVMSALPSGEVQGKKLEGDPSAEVFAPLTTLKGQFGETIMSRTTGSFSAERVQIHQLFVKVGERANVIPASKVIEKILQQSHDRKDYEVIVPLQLLEQAKQTQRIFSIVLGSIAAISLLVGGIGIMNITLATVMERTREIGIRRAMGAKKADIVAQFLSETVLLAAFGGGLGIAFGILGPYMVRHFTQMSTVVTAWSLILAFSISAIVGLAFGIYPAYRAANMDPIEALRHE